jgi:NAD(P)-dependent dehydrogenase (short-subunit alcohol dehydrogenase family)
MTRSKTIFITGASSGIGATCAVGLAERGYRVFAGVRKPADGERLERAGGGNIGVAAIDVTDPASIDRAVATLRAALAGEGLDALFNNAGIAVVAPLECVPLDELRRQLEVNVVGTVAVTQAFLPLLRVARGRVITTGSIGGFIASPLLGPYNMSKYALEAFNDALRLEVEAQGIKVILLEPGTISTGMKDKCDGSAKALRERAPAHCAELYDQLFEAMMRYGDTAIDRASDPQVVLNAVIDAIESPHPKTRYLIGHSARLQSLLRRLPDKLRDRVVLGALRRMAASSE